MKRHLFRRMGRFLRPQAPSLAGAAALAALSGLLALLVPLVAGWAVEAIGTGPGAADLTAVLRCCAAGLGAAVLSAVCSYGASAALVKRSMAELVVLLTLLRIAQYAVSL